MIDPESLAPYSGVAEFSAVRDSVLRRITHLLRTDLRVEAAWLSGSFGRGEADEWSDLDLHVAVANLSLDEFLAYRPALYAAVADPVLVQDEMPSNSLTDGTYQLVWFAGGVQVDWNIGPAGRARKPHAHQLIFERRPFEVVALPDPSEPERRVEARRSLVFFWAMAPIAMKYVARRASAEAAGMVGLLTDALIRLWRLTSEHAGPAMWDPALTNRGLEDELDQRLPKLDADITPTVLCQVITDLCQEVRLLEPRLRELSVEVDQRLVLETQRLLQLCRQTLTAG